MLSGLHARACRQLTDVPRLVGDLVELQHLHAVNGTLGGRQVHLVGEEEQRDRAEIWMAQHRLELVFGDTHADGIGRVDAKDDAADVLVVVLPQVPIPPLPRHVKDCERQAVL